MRNFKIGEYTGVFTDIGRVPLIQAWGMDLVLSEEYKVDIHKCGTPLRYIILENETETVVLELGLECRIMTTKGLKKVKDLVEYDEVVTVESGPLVDGVRKTIHLVVTTIKTRKSSHHYEVKGDTDKPLGIYKDGVYFEIH